jgi:hypothetical protein
MKGLLLDWSGLCHLRGNATGARKKGEKEKNKSKKRAATAKSQVLKITCWNETCSSDWRHALASDNKYATEKCSGVKGPTTHII